MSSSASTPSVPRPAASLLILTPSNRIVLLHRPRTSSTFANAHVFPGGAVSASDSSPLTAAFREAFEETGLLLTAARPPPHILAALPDVQRSVYAGTVDFAAWLQSWGGELVRAAKFTRWVTPVTMKRRFESQMYLCGLPEWMDEGEAEKIAALGDRGAGEVASTTLLTPAEALMRARKEDETGMVFFPPQFYLLSRLAEKLGEMRGVEDVMDWAEKSGFGELVIEPRMIKRLGDGKWVMGLGETGDQDRVVVLEMPQGLKGEPRGVEMRWRKDIAKI